MADKSTELKDVLTVTLLVLTVDKLPAASTVYNWYEPFSKPVKAKLVLVLAELMATEFQAVSAALVMLASLVTLTLLLTKYAVPVSLLCTVALDVLASVAVVTLAVGAVASTI